MNAFVSKIMEVNGQVRERATLEILQVNMGDLCNQSCKHCHVGASPRGENTMSRKTVDKVIEFLRKKKELILDITGGAPEMNLNFRYFVEKARPLAKELIVRSNLTVLLENGQEDIPDFYRKNKVRLICSLPCYTEENVDKQRGGGVFEKSIAALKILNAKGYAAGDLKIDLVYNPGGAFLPGPQKDLETDYKKALKEKYDIDFNALITITNVPIKRFKDDLREKKEYEKYMDLLKDNFNEHVVVNVMCRTLLSVGWDGTLYDCDFNQAADIPVVDPHGRKLHIEDVAPDDLDAMSIRFSDHCFCCTAGAGSSCQGSLKKVGQERTREMVSDYYGNVLSGSEDLKTTACCNIESVPKRVREVSRLIAPEISAKFYGCGSPIPLELKGTKVLDLGCGTGKDSYIIACLSGEKGEVVGVDMTDAQLKVANNYVDHQMKMFGFAKPNIKFLKGHIEDLKKIGLKDAAFDIVVSNCVVNLSARKDQVFAEVYRVLKSGGEFYFSDVFCDRRLPEWMKDDPVLVGECLGGALYWKDFERLASSAGFPDIRVYSSKPIKITDPGVRDKVGDTVFTSVTYRMFKIDGLEDACENYGEKAVYEGGIEDSLEEFILDDHHVFGRGEEVEVCGNTAAILSKTRFSKYFNVIGDRSKHYGLFPGCGTGPTIAKEEDHGCCC